MIHQAEDRLSGVLRPALPTDGNSQKEACLPESDHASSLRQIADNVQAHVIAVRALLERVDL